MLFGLRSSVLCCVLSMSAASGAVAPPVAFTLSGEGAFTGAGVGAGTVQASGGISASGTLDLAFSGFGNPGGGLFVIVFADGVFTTPNGSFRTHNVLLQTATGPTTSLLRGPFQLEGISGAYEGLRGSGLTTVNLDFVANEFDFTSQGRLTP